MNSKIVDVVIPNYERTKKLLRAVESVLIQGEVINQIIIVDDGSSPNVLEFINQNISHLPKVKVMSIPHSGNPGMVRNIGIDQSNSEYVAFLDSDDFWFPGKIDLQLAKFKNKNIVLVCSNARLYQNNKIIKNYFNKKSRTIKQSNLWFENIVINSSVLVKSNVLKKVGGYSELNTVIGLEDYITWVEIINEGDLYFMQDCLLGYTNSASSISFMVSEEQRLTCRKLIYSKLNYTNRFIYTLNQIQVYTKKALYGIFLKVRAEL